MKFEFHASVTGSLLRTQEIPDDTPEHLRCRVALQLSAKARADLAGADLADAKLRDGITVTRAPLQINGLAYPVTIWDQHAQIGCHFHSIAEWAAMTEAQICALDRGAVAFWRAHRDALLALARSDGRGVETTTAEAAE